MLIKLKEPLIESILNLSISAPPLNDQVTSSSALNISTILPFSISVFVPSVAPAILDPLLIKGAIVSPALSDSFRLAVKERKSPWESFTRSEIVFRYAEGSSRVCKSPRRLRPSLIFATFSR